MRINRALLAASILALGTFTAPVSVFAEENENRQQQHEDARPDGRGNRLRGLPERAPTGGAVVTGNGINYHNGPVMRTVNLYYIYYGSWTSGQKTLLESWANNIGGSPYFNINTTYGDTVGNVPNAVTFKGSFVDTGTLGSSLNDNSIATLAAHAITSFGSFDPNGLYMVLTSPGIAETSGFLTSYCGWHWSGGYSNGAITAGSWSSGQQIALFSFVGNAAGPSIGSCAGQTSSSPNGDVGVDAMISVMAHELEEAATDPQGNAWYDTAGNENGDKCAWNFGTTSTAGNGSKYNVTLGGLNYLIQQNWLNAGGGKCAMSYATTADFSVSVSGSQTVPKGGTSGNYTLTATPLNGFNGTVTWSIAPPAGITASSPASGSGATFTLTAAANLAAGTYSVPVTGTSGALTHTVNASLVVSAPSFGLSITAPTSKTVTRPSSGTKTVSFPIVVSPVGGFAGNVTLTVSGATTGVTPSIVGSPVVGGNGTSTLNVVISSSATRRTRSFTVTGSSPGATSKTATASVTIQ